MFNPNTSLIPSFIGQSFAVNCFAPFEPDACGTLEPVYMFRKFANNRPGHSIFLGPVQSCSPRDILFRSRGSVLYKPRSLAPICIDRSLTKAVIFIPVLEICRPRRRTYGQAFFNRDNDVHVARYYPLFPTRGGRNRLKRLANARRGSPRNDGCRNRSPRNE